MQCSIAALGRALGIAAAAVHHGRGRGRAGAAGPRRGDADDGGGGGGGVRGGDADGHQGVVRRVAEVVDGRASGVVADGDLGRIIIACEKTKEE